MWANWWECSLFYVGLSSSWLLEAGSTMRRVLGMLRSFFSNSVVLALLMIGMWFGLGLALMHWFPVEGTVAR